MSVDIMLERLRRERERLEREEEKVRSKRRRLWIEFPRYIVELFYIPLIVTWMVSESSAREILWCVAIMIAGLFNALNV